MAGGVAAPTGWGQVRRASPYLLAGLLTVTWTMHFVAPKVFASIIPPQLPYRSAGAFASVTHSFQPAG